MTDLRIHFIKNNLLTFGGNAKIDKNEIPTYNLSLLPHSMNSLKENLCKNSTAECRALCLNMSGRGAFNSVQKVRELRTEFYVQHNKQFLIALCAELARINTMHPRALIRLNTFSDIDWKSEFKKIGIYIEDFVNLTFYGYTKRPELIKNKAKNEEFVFSFSGKNSKDAKYFLDNKITNVAVVFEKELPERFWGAKVINGDTSDQRLKEIEGTGNIVGLKYKKPKGVTLESKSFVIK